MGFGDVGAQKKQTGGFGSTGAQTKVGGGFGGAKPDLTTPKGLTNVAEKAGLGKEAQAQIPKGEDPSRAFSGGFIQDTFDVLNAPQAVVAGLAQNKSPIDAIMSRASFSDEALLGKYGGTGVIAGIIADIATDPLMLIPPLGIGKRLLSGIKGGAEFISKTKMGVPVADFLGKRFVYRFGQDPVYAKLAEDAIHKINKGGQKAVAITKPITELAPEEQRVIANARKSGNLTGLSADLLGKAKPAFDELDRLGQEAVNVGLLPKEVYDANVKTYLARLYKTKEAPEGVAQKVFGTKPVRADLARFKGRKDIPEDVRESMGEILEAGYPLAKSLAQLNQAVERAKFFGEVAGKWGADEWVEGLSKASLPSGKNLGALAGKHVPEAIYDDIQEIVRAKSWGEKIAGKAVQGFKYGKVILNPATHARNTISNFILNDFAGLSPARVDIYAKAASEMKNKGKFYKEALDAGLGIDTFWAGEIKALLTNSSDPAIKRIPKEIVNKMGELYQKEEQFAKMAQFIFQREKGLSSDDAFRIAEAATFNYAQVTPFIRRLRESVFGMPFITFTYKTTPLIGKTLITKPAKIGKYGLIKRDFEKLSPEKQLEEERKAEPDYMRKGFYVRLPIEDQHGRPLYFDMTYILPFGDIFSGSMFETERPGEPFQKSALRKFPLLNAVGELYTNEDFFGEQIVKSTSDDPIEVGKDIISYLIKQYGPPPFTETPKRLKQALELEDMTKAERGSKRTVTEEILRNFGLKVKPFVTEQEKSRREREAREGIQTLLEQEGVVKEFKRPFIPK